MGQYLYRSVKLLFTAILLIEAGSSPNSQGLPFREGGGAVPSLSHLVCLLCLRFTKVLIDEGWMKKSLSNDPKFILSGHPDRLKLTGCIGCSGCFGCFGTGDKKRPKNFSGSRKNRDKKMEVIGFSRKLRQERDRLFVPVFCRKVFSGLFFTSSGKDVRKTVL